jgi:dTDP-glucose 4,6-dehydratase
MIIVTGGAGFIGSNFLHYLTRVTDDEVVVLDNITYAANESYIPSQHKFIWCDISDAEHVEYIFNKVKPTKVFNFAAESHVDNSIKDVTPFINTNITGTVNLLRSSVTHEVEKFYHISTDEVYGSLEYGEEGLFTEKTPYDPRNPYSATKAAAEHMVRTWYNTYGLPYLITSSSNNYGPGQHEEKLIPKVIKNALNDEITYMHDGGEQIRDWMHVDDHCCAIWTLDEKKVLNDKFNIGGGCEVQNIEVTRKILDMLNKPHSLIGVSNDRPGVDKRYGTDFSKLTERTGWVPQIPFDAGLGGTVRFYMNKYS